MLANQIKVCDKKECKIKNKKLILLGLNAGDFLAVDLLTLNLDSSSFWTLALTIQVICKDDKIIIYSGFNLSGRSESSN